ncbi:HU family DNA-binding protein [Piscinibacter gummiphilus]|uniref:HU family DNA-binding protein n=1 Tax=Piscinibacter gummiphilus TaxID=946333 RepID=A0ABZ0CNH4_9BURK|nr:HU family DNA-binding protein [Piscinibacter gummiphilus]WOB06527.1 HU family DNA-binding protein [Piscinibacter gummiphilus]
MKKAELIGAVAEASGKPKALVREILDAATEVVRAAIEKHNPVFLFGVGKLTVKRRKPRPARDMHKHEQVMVPERNVVLFRPSDSMKAAANVKLD